MAAQPKKKLSRSRSRKRFSTKTFKPTKLGTCANCKKPVVPHTVCESCGFYKGKQVLKVAEKVEIKKVEKDER
ncbi:MAG: 50S ribosomal protein L32 [Candidatus Woykebacteria bacterium RIFCSPLOWO2_01_FULL_41_12]|uniref:Large ribosomal subunit protein bL32 n=1 Tax=Candidatus Woykebacteria bacterium RIFCSPLOWO2_01_FULL_41_12 TaxID=1802604 RepID=A0A1G1WVH1_9BACT|nr:MAG: 50S ribosomal protein L32 [Candidatus Woykebacteria bacterium RIFCSPLOWO2_01_FULL_41_12]